jgi:TldD protein
MLTQDLLSRDIINEVLRKALSTGGDFAEIFVENTLKTNLNIIDSKVDAALSARTFGAGIRVMKGTKSVYAATNDLSLFSLLNVAGRLADVIGQATQDININLTLKNHKLSHAGGKYEIDPWSLKAKTDVAKSAYFAAKNYSDEITQVSVNAVDWDSDIMVANSNGILTFDKRIYTRLATFVVASDGTENQTGHTAPGRRMGYEMFNDINIEQEAKNAAKTAVTMLHASECPSAKMPVAIENGFGGVIFHEACGHSLEATSVGKGNSEFTGKLGQKIANEKVTAIDDGTLPCEWGSIDIDDEGTEGRKNVLIENGVLKGYMIDTLGSRRMDMPVTGSARRESYEYAPTSRMTNTFIAAGNDEDSDIIKSIPDGLYAKQMGGGSVNPVTGEFNFSVAEGYRIRNGEICEAVRGASLVGRGSEVLMKIDMVGKHLAFGQGMCGSISGSVPTNVGQPLIRVSDITVGGRG